MYELLRIVNAMGENQRNYDLIEILKFSNGETRVKSLETEKNMFQRRIHENLFPLMSTTYTALIIVLN